MASPQSAPESRSKFSIYQNVAVSSALAARSLRPSLSSFVVIIVFLFGASLSMVAVVSREEILLSMATEMGFMQSVACYLVRLLQSLVVIIFLAAVSALCKALSLQALSDSKIHFVPKPDILEGKEGSGKGSALTERQRVLLGVSSGKHKRQSGEKERPLDAKQPRARTASSPSASLQSSLLVPVHQSLSNRNGRGSGSSFARAGLEWQDSGINKISPVVASNSVGMLATPFQSSPYMSPPQSVTPPSDMHVSPWAKQSSSHPTEEIVDEEKLEEFLADVEDKMVESSGKIPSTTQALLTPPPTLRGVNITPPTSALTPSSTPRSTPIRSLRISPSSQKFSSSPRKGEGDLPPPMSMEQVTEAFQKLGVFPQIEIWRDQIRQWFSKDLLNPLVCKIDSSHIQVMQVASKLGFSLNVSPVGGNKSDTKGPSLSPIDAAGHEWITTFAPDEDAMLHQMRAFLVQARDTPPPPPAQPSLFGLQPQPQPQVWSINPAIQECLDAVSEHQRLKALIKGEWAKGLLPQSSVRADYTVQRIRELAEGTCVKKYEYLATGELYDKISKRWTLELPTDSHLLVYLFCALLEHPNWMLHIDPASQPSTQSANNPIFIVNLPHKERCPEKYVAILSSSPAVLHLGASVLVVGKQNPPIFALYWDKKLQFSLQGRTALWDAILLLCYRIKVAHGGVVQGINLGSTAFNLLPIFETPEPDDVEQ